MGLSAMSCIVCNEVRDRDLCHYINDSVFDTYSAIVFNHCQYSVKSLKRGQPSSAR